MKAGSADHQAAVDKVKASIDSQQCSVAEQRRRCVDRAHAADHPYTVRGEQYHANEALRALLESVGPQLLAKLGDKLGSGPDARTVSDLRDDLVTVTLQAIALQRHGYAEGSLARHPDGRYARRYYSEEHKRLRWLVNEPPTDGNVTVDAVDEFTTGDGWQVAVIEPWKVVF